MTRAKPIFPGQLWFITVRCQQRRFRLRPRRWLRHLLEYLLAVGAERFGVRLVAMYVASNHYHLVLEDLDGRLPDFTQWFNSLVARFVNVKQAESDSVWTPAGPDCALLADPDAVEAKIVYALANPVKDGLVAHGREWLGLRTRPQDFWQPPRVVSRPAAFFREGGPLPDKATLRWHVPSSHAGMSPTEFGQRIAAQLGDAEAKYRAQLASAGRKPIGARRAAAVDYDARPQTDEPHGPGTVPSEVIARDPTARRSLVQRVDHFRDAYVAAQSEWRAGNRLVLWPSGTWQMHRHHGVLLHPPPAIAVGPN
ncbi:MAG: putative transposase [Myxococcota bacterium]|jgi:putative transposase